MSRIWRCTSTAGISTRRFHPGDFAGVRICGILRQDPAASKSALDFLRKIPPPSANSWLVCLRDSAAGELLPLGSGVVACKNSKDSNARQWSLPKIQRKTRKGSWHSFLTNVAQCGNASRSCWIVGVRPNPAWILGSTT